MKKYKCMYCKKEFDKIGEVYNHYYESNEIDINVKIQKIGK